MLNKFLIIIAVTLNLISCSLYALNEEDLVLDCNIPCAVALQPYLSCIQQLPEARKLIADVQMGGGVRIEVNTIHLPEKFGAFWDVTHRIIFVNLSAKRSPGLLIASILFELHNALISSKLDALDALAMQHRISRNAYTEAVERMEYQNSIQASALSVKGIELGIFPKSAYLPVYQTFEEYYQIQRKSGHSAWISKTYDQLILFH